MIPKAVAFSLLPALASALLQHYLGDGIGGEAILTNSVIWSGLSFLVGIFIVFKTTQAQGRFWEGTSSVHQMRAEWFDFALSVMSFTKLSKAPPEQTKRFKELFIRLLSMLNAAALAELEKGDRHLPTDLAHHDFTLIDPLALDAESLGAIRAAEDRVELLCAWIQQLLIENIETGVLTVPPPLLTRSFQQMAGGLIQFHNAMKLACVSIPFPYAQACDWLLILYTLLCPLITSQSVAHWVWAFVFTFVQVVVLWCLNLVAAEIENPFGTDDNDLDGDRIQYEFNRQLIMLKSAEAVRTPRLSSEWEEASDKPLKKQSSMKSLIETGSKQKFVHLSALKPKLGASTPNLENIILDAEERDGHDDDLEGAEAAATSPATAACAECHSALDIVPMDAAGQARDDPSEHGAEVEHPCQHNQGDLWLCRQCDTRRRDECLAVDLRTAPGLRKGDGSRVGNAREVLDARGTNPSALAPEPTSGCSVDLCSAKPDSDEIMVL